ncbi:unnamed protein product, partial [Staurois parvus]
MALGRKMLTSGMIKGLTVCCFTVCAGNMLLCIALHSRAIQSSMSVLT